MPLQKGELDKFEGTLVDNQYKIGAQIGAGSYGQVRFGVNTKTNKMFAMKFEEFDADSQLKNEYDLLQFIHSKAKTKKGFSKVFYFGMFQKNYQVLVMELLGKNVEQLFEKCNKNFSLKTIIFVTLQLLKRFETLHGLNIVYRDVKPENFVLGFESNTIYMIDFGLSKFFVDDNGHLPYVYTHEYIGTSRYMSINAHHCKEQSRRDDLEAFCYMLAYFFTNGKLPWSGIRAKNFNDHHKTVLTLKRTFPEEQLMAGAPSEFVYLLRYCRFLEFDQTPSYTKLRNMFKKLFVKNNFKDDGVYDWTNFILPSSNLSVTPTQVANESTPQSGPSPSGQSPLTPNSKLPKKESTAPDSKLN